jgi:nucleoside-diphosphate-sugar epimerase
MRALDGTVVGGTSITVVGDELLASAPLPTGWSTMSNALRQIELLDQVELKPENPRQARVPARPAKGAPIRHAPKRGAKAPVAPVAPAPAPEPEAQPEAAPAPEAPISQMRAPEAPGLGTVLVLGGTGSFGGAVAADLLSRGFGVRLLVRDAPVAWTRFGADPNLRMAKGDARDTRALVRAAEGCEAIVHAVGGPIRRWSPDLLTMTHNVIEAARANNATILFPGHTLAIGPIYGRPLPESIPSRPGTHAGVVRAQIEDQLRMAAAGGRCRTLVLRVGDCFGPTVRNDIVDGIFANALAGEPMIGWGNLDEAHQWAYMPDVARIAVELLIMGRGAHAFDSYEVINFGGHIVRPQRLFYRKVADALEYTRCAIRRRTWIVAGLRALGSAPAREMLERRGEFDHPVLLDDTKLMRLFPRFEPTPLDEAIVRTLESYRNG